MELNDSSVRHDVKAWSTAARVAEALGSHWGMRCFI